MLKRWKNPEGRAHVDRIFHLPMLVLAFLILPLLALALFAPLSSPGELLVEIGFWAIWLSFLAEFVVKISIAESKWAYVRKNWLDIIVILLPLLRPLRALRVARSLQVGRSLRLLSLRAVAQKGLTATIFLIAHYRALRKGLDSNAGRAKGGVEVTPELSELREELARVKEEARQLREELARLSGEGKRVEKEGAASGEG